MEGEINNFIKVWVSFILSVCYCFAVAKIIPKGTTRFITFFPVVCLLLVYPFNLTSVHLGSPIIFIISWLGNFKLLLFAFGESPLSDPSLSLNRFVALVCFPVIIRRNSSNSIQKDDNKKNSYFKTSKFDLKSALNYTIKVLFLFFLLSLNNYRDFFHPKLLLFFVCLYTYIGLDILLAVMATLARTMLGLEFAPQFNAPYLATSLQDLWGYRWNLVASDNLRIIVYRPVFRCFIPILGQKWAFVPAVMATFLVSGLMHELLMYHHCRVWPTWGAMYFFLLHGFLLIVEITLKKTLNCSWQLPQLISGPLIFGFVAITIMRFMVAQLIRFKVDHRAIEEYEAVKKFVRDLYPPSSYTYNFF